MDSLALLVFVGALVIYFWTKKKYVEYLFLAGIGLGAFLEAVWVAFVIMSKF